MGILLVYTRIPDSNQTNKAVLAEEFEGCHQGGRERPQQRIDVTNMRKFVGISEISDIPGQEKVTLMVGRQGQVRGIACRVTGHHQALDVGLDNLDDRGLNRDEWYLG